MGSIQRAVIACLAFAIVPVAFVGQALAQRSAPPLPIKEAALTRWVFGRNATIEDTAIACKAQTGPCVPGSRHLSFVAPVAVPSMTACASGSATLLSCYAGAIERTQQALAAGNAALLYEAAERTRVVTKRAENSSNAPGWLSSTSPDHLLYRFYVDQGLPLAAPISCTTGTETARYQCLAGSSGPSAAVHRAAIGILDHHNDVRVNRGQTAGARVRLENILRSATAPTVSAMTAAGKLDPRLGPGLPRLDILGKIAYLRRLTGEAGTVDAERAYFEALTAYQVDASSTRVGAELALFAAARAARWTDPATGMTKVTDTKLAADLTALLANTDTATHLELVRGLTDSALRAGHVTGYFTRPFTARPFDALLPDRFALDFDWFGGFHFGWLDGSDHCDWFTVEDIIISMTAVYPVTETKRVWIPDCLPHDPDCDPDAGHWDTITTTTWVTGPTTVRKIGEEVIAESIRTEYGELLDADDGDWVDVDDANSDPDHDLANASALVRNATIARTGISAPECLAELASFTGGYSHALAAVDLDCDSSDPDCQSAYGGSDGRMYLPYAMAARLCPMYVKNAVGIDAVTLVNGEISSIAPSCPTALEFVARVALTLEDADSKYIEAIDQKAGAIGALLGYFAAEANLLTAPVAGMLRQRADLAYFSAEPLGTCGDTPTGDCVGLDVLEERLALAEDAVLKGLALYRQFSRIDRGEVGLDGDEAIATFAADSVGVCQACSGTCLECLSNSTDQLHALTYRRLRDALGIYESIRNDRMEVLWRRLDAMPTSCVAPADTDADGVLDTNACAAADPACTSFCPHYDAARALVEATGDDMAVLATDLDEQLAAVNDLGTSPELSELLGDIYSWAAGIAPALVADLNAIDSGVDWLGDRKGRWSVTSAASGSTLTEEIEAELAMLEVDAGDFSGEYDSWLTAYLGKLSVESQFAAAATEASLAVQGNIGAYCQDLQGNPAPDGCGLDVALTDTNSTAERINDVLETKFCKVAVGQLAWIAIDLADPLSPNFLDPGDVYLDWIASVGLTSCPRLVTPDVADLTSRYGGSLIVNNVLGIERALLELEAAIHDFNAYIAFMQDADQLFTVYENAVDEYATDKATKEWLTDSLVCGAALIGATAATIASSGAGAGTFVGAGSTCVQRFAQGSENLFPNDGNYTAEELSFEASFINQQVQRAEQLYSASMKLESVMLRVADYRAAVLAYQSELAAFRRTVAFGNTTLDALGAYQVFADPLYVAIEQQELTSLRHAFKGFAGSVNGARRKIEYDISNILPVGQIYRRTLNEQYWMPRVADITIASSVGANPPDAYMALATNGTPAPASAQTLVATASLLLKIYDDFRLTYGERYDFGLTGYIGSPVPGFVDANVDGVQDVSAEGELLFGNRGERAMLGDSRFYDPSGTTASGCAAGWVDVSDYCQAFSNSAAIPAPGNCADIQSMPLGRRLDLAHLDHMVRTPGVETFDCTVDPVDGSFHIAARAGSGVMGIFTGGPAGDLPFHVHQAPWYRGAIDTVDTTFYLAQTALVRALIDVYLDGVLDGRAELSANFKFYPGTYLYAIDMTDPWFEPEHDLLSGSLPFAAQTQSEQLDALAVICTSATACGADSIAIHDSKPIDLVLFGNGYKGSRCRYTHDPVTLLDGSVSPFAVQAGLLYADGTARQAQLEFEMDHDLSAGNVQSLKTTAPESQQLVEDVLDNATLLQRPLHVSRALIGVYGIYDTSGMADNANIWALHVGGGQVNPRLRIATRYSHYNTDPIVGAASIDIDEFLACPANTERM